MAQLDHVININDLPVDEGAPNFDPLPDGDYTVQIVKADLKETNDGQGNYFNFQLKVTEGKFANRFIFAMVTRRNKSEKAEQIGHGQLRTIMESGGLSMLQDTDQLIGISVSVRVGSEIYNDKPKNTVKWKAIEGQAFSSSAMPAAKTATVAAGKTPPWAARK